MNIKPYLVLTGIYILAAVTIEIYHSDTEKALIQRAINNMSIDEVLDILKTKRIDAVFDTIVKNY